MYHFVLIFTPMTWVFINRKGYRKTWSSLKYNVIMYHTAAGQDVHFGKKGRDKPCGIILAK